MTLVSPSATRARAGGALAPMKFSALPKLQVVSDAIELPVLFAGENYTIEAGLFKTIVTKSTIGLDKVDNTSDMAKPISTATQAAIDELLDRINEKANLSDLGALGARVGANERKIADLELFMTSGLIPADRITGLNPVIDARIDAKIDGIVAPTVFAGPNDW